jgi:hypothetical protein
MPLQLHPITPSDTVAWMRIRTVAYYGPTHKVLHNGTVSDSSIRAVAEDRKRDLKKPHTWHWKTVDTDLEPGEDDPADNGGRTIAISVWSMHNVKKEGSDEPASVPAVTDDKPNFLPPELRLDALSSLFDPLRAAQKEIMGTSEPYFMLNSLATHPEYRGRGAAKIMLDWGLKEADNRELPTYLDATGMARPIYEKRGFVVVKGVDWDRVPWGGKGTDTHWCMRRKMGGLME